MKTVLHYFSLLLVFLIHQDLTAQQENVSSVNTGNSQEQNLENNRNFILNSVKNTLVVPQVITNSAFNNSIQITQIGDYNNYQIQLKAAQSALKMNQFGDKNEVNLYKSVPNIMQSIQQNGDSNYISDFSTYSNQKVDMQINQQGNNLNLYSNGTNSISKDLKITQTGNSGTVYIFNR